MSVLRKSYTGTAFGATMGKSDAVDAGVESVRKTFPESKCSADCLRAQLKDYYDKLNCRPKKESGIADNKHHEVESEGAI